MDYYSDHTNANAHQLKYRIIHANNCGTQHECRQNFLKQIKNYETHQCTCTHKFSQKHGFKGAWDGASKLVKNAITRLELKLTRVDNAKDFYYHLSPIISKEDSNIINWKQHTNGKSLEALKKTTWTSDKTFACLGIEDSNLCQSSHTNDPFVF